MMNRTTKYFAIKSLRKAVKRYNGVWREIWNHLIVYGSPGEMNTNSIRPYTTPSEFDMEILNFKEKHTT